MTADSLLRMDLSELVRLSDDLATAPARIVAAVTPAVKRGANNIKTDAFWRIQSIVGSGRGYARAYPYSISYDLYRAPHRVVAEIGPDKDKEQGALGNLLEYGSANNPPMPHLAPAARTEIPRTELAVTRAAIRAMFR